LTSAYCFFTNVAWLLLLALKLLSEIYHTGELSVEQSWIICWKLHCNFQWIFFL